MVVRTRPAVQDFSADKSINDDLALTKVYIYKFWLQALTDMYNFGHQRKAASDYEYEVTPSAYSRERSSQSLPREMSNAQRIPWVMRFIIDPIMEEDMPGLFTVEYESNFQLIVLKVKERSIRKFKPYPCLGISWDQHHSFRATANPMADLDAAPYGDPAMTRAYQRVAPRLAVQGVSTLGDLMRVAPDVRRMASTVFRDAWLLYNLRQEENWWMPETEMYFDKVNEITTLRKLEVYSLGRDCSVAITIAEPSAHSDGGFVITPRVTAECPERFWKRRFMRLGAPPPIEHLVIHHYQTHADADRVMDTLRVLLRP